MNKFKLAGLLVILSILVLVGCDSGMNSTKDQVVEEQNVSNLEEIDESYSKNNTSSIALNKSVSSVVPTGLPWPIKDKGVQDISFFFDVEDCVKDVIPKKSDGSYLLHLGIDIKTNSGDKVYPISTGEVKYIANGGVWGKAVILEHDDSWTSVYWHVNPTVSVGDSVDVNTSIGTVYDVSSTGDVNHLHLGIRPLPYSYTYSKIGYQISFGDNLYGFVNPLDYLDHNGYAMFDDTYASYSGNWIDSKSTDLYYGNGYKVTNDSNASAEYVFNLDSDGSYLFYTHFTIDPNRTKEAKYTIFYNNYPLKTVKIDQTNINYRGTNVIFAGYSGFKAGGQIKIKVENASSGYLVSDGILLVKL